MQHHQENDQLKLNKLEQRFIEVLRLRKENPPTECELDLLLRLKEQQAVQNRDLLAFLQENKDSLAGAIHTVLNTVLYMDNFFDHPGTQQAYSILFLFNSILIPPPEMDI